MQIRSWVSSCALIVCVAGPFEATLAGCDSGSSDADDADDVGTVDASDAGGEQDAGADAAEDGGAPLSIDEVCEAQHACKASISVSGCASQFEEHLGALRDAGATCSAEYAMYDEFIQCTGEEPCDAWPASGWPARCADLDEAFNDRMSSSAGAACADAVGY